MPNWCENTLIVSGNIPGAVYNFHQSCLGKYSYFPMEEYELNSFHNPEDKEEAIKKHREVYDALPLRFCFSALVPVPQNILDIGYSSVSNLVDHNGYSWCCTNWGTKWDIYDNDITTCDNDDIRPEEDMHVYDFDTAWGPPLQWAEEASRLSPNVTITLEYAEPGECIAGKFIYKAGKAIEETQYMGAELDAVMKELGYQISWREEYKELNKDEAKLLFNEGVKVFGIDENEEACEIEIKEDLEDFDFFATDY